MEPGEGKRSFTDRSGAAGKAWLTCNTPYPANLCRLHCLVEFASRGEEAIASLAEVEMSEHQAEFFYDTTMFGMLIDFCPTQAAILLYQALSMFPYEKANESTS